MNQLVFSKLSLCPMPKSVTLGNSFDINQFGVICILSQLEGLACIRYQNLRASKNELSTETCKVLPIPNENFACMGFTNISFNTDGSCLLVWSKTSIGVVFVPNNIRTGETADQSLSCDECVFFTLADDVLADMSSGSIVEARFHKDSSNHVIVLRECGQLLVINIAVFTDDNCGDCQVIFLRDNRKFKSFEFGPAMDFMTFSILLVSEEDEIFALCPIIPSGLCISQEVINDLWSWTDEQGNWDRARDQVNTYHGFTTQYLECMFGPRQDYTSQSNSRSRWSRKRDAVQVSYSAEDAMKYMPVLQGPLLLERGGGDRKSGSSLTRGVKNTNKTLKVTSICCAGSRSLGCEAAVPVLSVAYSSGDVELLLFTACDQSRDEVGLLGPSWDELRDEEVPDKCLCAGLPRLLSVESITSCDDCASAADWKISMDPVHVHLLHHVNMSRGLSFMISSKWIEEAMTDASSELNSEDSLHSSSRGTGVDKRQTNKPPGSKTIPMSSRIAVVTPSESTSGQVAAVNISMCLRLDQLRNKAPNESVFAMTNGPDEAQQRRLRELFVGVKCSLERVPMPAGDETYDEASRSCVHDLQAAKTFIGEHIALPLEEAKRRIHFQMDSLKTEYRSQAEYLDDSDLGHDRQTGMRYVLKKMSDQQVELRSRVSAIMRKFEEQKAEVADKLQHLNIALHNQGSKSRQELHRQLLDWQTKVSKLDKDIECLRRSSKMLGQTGSACVSPAPGVAASSSSSQSQSPLLSGYISPLGPASASGTPTRKSQGFAHTGGNSFFGSPSPSSSSQGLYTTPLTSARRPAHTTATATATTSPLFTQSTRAPPTPYTNASTVSKTSAAGGLSFLSTRKQQQQKEQQEQQFRDFALSPEEITVCEDMLKAQSDELQATKEMVLSIEAKLRRSK